jgi:hypothetical protein
VTVHIKADQEGLLDIVPAELVFSSKDWSQTQRATIRAVGDDVYRGNSLASPVVAKILTDDPQFDGNVIPSLGWYKIEDNDIPQLVLGHLSQSALQEGAGAVHFEALLGSQPLAPVTVSIRVPDKQLRVALGTEASTMNQALLSYGMSAKLVFDPLEWRQKKYIFARAVKDGKTEEQPFHEGSVVFDMSSEDKAYDADSLSTSKILRVIEDDLTMPPSLLRAVEADTSLHVDVFMDTSSHAPTVQVGCASLFQLGAYENELGTLNCRWNNDRTKITLLLSTPDETRIVKAGFTLTLKSDTLKATSTAVLAAVGSVVVEARTPAPALASAIFGSTGATVVVVFDSPTDRAGQHAGKSSCAKVFSNSNLGKGALCRWPSVQGFAGGQQVVITLGPSATLAVGSFLELLEGALRSAEGALLSSSGKISVLRPTHPAIELKALIKDPPTKIAACDELLLDASSSEGNAGRALEFKWSVDTTSPQQAQLEDFVQANGASRFVVPANLLVPGYQHRFRVAVSNFLSDDEHSSEVTVDVDAFPVPFVGFEGGLQVLQVSPQDNVALKVRAKASLCGDANQIGTKIQFKWTCPELEQQGTSLFAYASQGVRVVMDGRGLEVNRYTLTGGLEYNFVVRAFMTSFPAIFSETSMRVVVRLLPVQPVICLRSDCQESALIVGVSPAPVLHGRSSFDPNFAPGAAARSLQRFRWSCTVHQAGASCPALLQNGATLEQEEIVFASSIGNFTVVLRVRQTVSAAWSNPVSRKIVVQAGSPPFIAIEAVGQTPTYAFVEYSVAYADATLSTEGVDLHWSQQLGNIPDLAAAQPLDIVIHGRRRQWAIPVQALTSGAKYVFRLRVNDGTTAGTVFSDVVVQVNSPPTSGTVVSSPPGGTAGETIFSLICEDWTDDPTQIPLLYEFRVLFNTVFYKGFDSRPGLNVVEMVFPLPAGNFSVHALISDSMGATAQASTRIQVQPAAALETEAHRTERATSRADAALLKQRDGQADATDVLGLVNGLVNELASVVWPAGSVRRLQEKVNANAAAKEHLLDVVTAATQGMGMTNSLLAQSCATCRTLLADPKETRGKLARTATDFVLHVARNANALLAGGTPAAAVVDCMHALGNAWNARQIDANGNETLSSKFSFTLSQFARGMIRGTRPGEAPILVTGADTDTGMIQLYASRTTSAEIGNALANLSTSGVVMEARLPSSKSLTNATAHVKQFVDVSAASFPNAVHNGSVGPASEASTASTERQFFSMASSSPVLRLTLVDSGSGTALPVHNLTEPVRIEFSLPNLSGSGKSLCVYWDNLTSRWSFEGIDSLEKNGTLYCNSTHLTDFSVGVKPEEALELLDDLHIAHILDGAAFSIGSVRENPYAIYAIGTILLFGLVLGVHASRVELHRHCVHVAKERGLLGGSAQFVHLQNLRAFSGFDMLMGIFLTMLPWLPVTMVPAAVGVFKLLLMCLGSSWFASGVLGWHVSGGALRFAPMTAAITSLRWLLIAAVFLFLWNGSLARMMWSCSDGAATVQGTLECRDKPTCIAVIHLQMSSSQFVFLALFACIPIYSWAMLASLFVFFSSKGQSWCQQLYCDTSWSCYSY